MIPRVDVEVFFVIVFFFYVCVCFSLSPNHPALTLVKLAPSDFSILHQSLPWVSRFYCLACMWGERRLLFSEWCCLQSCHRHWTLIQLACGSKWPPLFLNPLCLFLEIYSPHHVISVTRKEKLDCPDDGFEEIWCNTTTTTKNICCCWCNTNKNKQNKKRKKRFFLSFF